MTKSTLTMTKEAVQQAVQEWEATNAIPHLLIQLADDYAGEIGRAEISSLTWWSSVGRVIDARTFGVCTAAQVSDLSKRVASTAMKPAA